MELKVASTNTQIASLQSMLEYFGAFRHRRRWARKQIKQMDSADGIIVSHTKSGRTWLRAMISHAYHLEYGVPADELLKFDNQHRHHHAIPRLFFARDTFIPTFASRGDKIDLPTDTPTLFLIRDPRDVAVSFYFHVINRASERELDRKGITSQDRELELYQFVVNERLGVPRVIEHMNRWLGDRRRLQNSIVVQYETLRADPEASMVRVLRFLDREFDPGIVKQAVQFASFENLSRKEAEGYFKTEKMRPTNPDDANSYKVRRGKIGGYQDYFDAEQISYIDKLVIDQLDPSYAYQ